MGVKDLFARVVSGSAGRVVETPVRDIVQEAFRQAEIPSPQELQAVRAEVSRLTAEVHALRNQLSALTDVVTDGEVVETHRGNPLDFIAAYQQRFKVALQDGMPRFCGGLAGYFGYDAVRYVETKLAHSAKPLPDTIATPDILLLQCE